MWIREIFVFFIAFLVTRFFWRWRRVIYLATKIPNSAFDVSLASLWEYYNADTKKIFEKLCLGLKKDGLTKSWIGPLLIINIDSPEDAKIVFNAKECIDKPYFVKEFPKLPRGTLFGDVESWRVHRKIINPYFGNKLLATAVIPVFNRKVKILMESIGKKESKGEFNVLHHMTALTLETILSVMEFDVDIQKQESQKRDFYIKNLEKYLEIVTLRGFKFWLHPEMLFKMSELSTIQEKAIASSAMIFAPDVIKKTRKQLTALSNNNNNDNDDNFAPEDGEAKHTTFIRALADPKNNFSDAELKDEVSSLIIAAQDTSAIASSSTLLLLAMHKDVQSKVVAELHEVLGNSITVGDLDVDQLNRLTYMEMAINEALRLIPVVPFVFRKSESEITSIEGYVIPSNSQLFCPIFKIHKSKKFWGEDAEEFKPERFAKESFEKIHPYAFIPFAKGPRMCIGWRYAMFLMKIQLANFLLRYEVDTSLKLSELEYEVNITLNVCQGYNISIRSRSEAL